MDINTNIFRAYDIRGIAYEDLTEEVVGAVDEYYHTTLDSVVDGAITEEYKNTFDITVTAAVNEIYNATWTNSTDGLSDWNCQSNIDIDAGSNIYLN